MDIFLILPHRTQRQIPQREQKFLLNGLQDNALSRRPNDGLSAYRAFFWGTVRFSFPGFKHLLCFPEFVGKQLFIRQSHPVNLGTVLFFSLPDDYETWFHFTYFSHNTGNYFSRQPFRFHNPLYITPFKLD